MSARFHRWPALLLSLAACLVAPAAPALPGFFAGKSDEKPINHSSQVVLMKKDGTTVVSVMPDYDGPIEPFALVLVVPEDVTLERVTTLQRAFVDRVDQISAPRFHEFWEMDPCEPGKVLQEWERDRSASSSTDFLGGPALGSATPVAKELFIDTEARQKQGEYSLSLLAEGEDLEKWLAKRGYKAPAGAVEAVAPYLERGFAILISEVDAKKIELAGGDRALLSPLRFWTEKPLESLPTTLSLFSGPEGGKQELLLFILDPEQRFEVKNYKTLFPPTNIEVDYVVKERMGEFYAALHDLFLGKHPKAFLAEYTWPTSGCGEPCPGEPLMIHELLSLGGDVFEGAVPDEEKSPKPPELSEQEEEKHKQSLEGLPPKEKREAIRQFKEDRETIAAKKALLGRHKYVLSRLHYLVDRQSLPEDPVLAAVSKPVVGGVGLPKGSEGELSTAVQPAEEHRMQTRFVSFHPWQGVLKCPGAERYRWGKAPRTYRGLRKIWITEDLSRKSRTQIKPKEVVRTPIAELGLGLAEEPKPSPPDAGGTVTGGEVDRCGCRTPGSPALPKTALWSLALAGLFWRLRVLRRLRKAGRHESG